LVIVADSATIIVAIQAGHQRQDLTPLPVKFWLVFSYLVVYDPAARPLAIVRVLHGRRDVEAILRPRT
jgi:antitoxin ParD1/3/4/toxin ParE1/3/4